MKFFLDANIPHSALKVFEEFNLEAVHARDIGLSKATDKEIFEYAVNKRCILVTKDLGFANITAFPEDSHYGIVIMRLPHFFKAQQFANALKDFLTSINSKDLEKALAIVKLGKYRIRKLGK